MDKTTISSNFALTLFTCLIMIYTTFSLTCDIVAFKMVKLNEHCFLMASAFLFPMLYVFVDIITELFGSKNARFAVLLHILCDCLFTFTILWLIHLPSPNWWDKQEAYNIVLNPMGGLYFAGVFASIVSSFLNIYFMQKFKNKMNGKFFAFRSSISSILGILIYTVITGFLAYSSQLDTTHLFQVVSLDLLTNTSFAMVYVFCITPIVSYCKKTITRKVETPIMHNFAII